MAVKTIDKHASCLRLLEGEVAIMRRAGRHENIVSLLEVFETDAKMHLVLELVEGGELFESIVDSGHMSEHDAAAMLRQVARALAYLHGRGIVHNDIKPENLLLTVDGRCKLTDMGLAKQTAVKTYISNFYYIDSSNYANKVLGAMQ